ncbi:nucleotide sugar dehydrogenase [Spiribacter aquaticus]|uniref:Nucleotide sugar dehydrogenase n=1 Tax=Spiribacter aquaticus TaxID=1935996 RepID=A0A557RM44_9GAMM|nr:MULTISPECIES: nucleotide sugar dehydrogenase [Spiribacter]KAF0279290.1 Vi polysaccharide biosynthesis protein VipA/TviB [Spiribacter roseus]TVO66249.1 nucleotide sugar dehydrogenase [Spiribacter aquaticus]
MNLPTHPRIAVIGLGYVGLPLAAAFSQAYPVVGFDVDARRIAELEAGRDRTEELDADELATAAGNGLRYTSDLEALRGCNVFVVTVPTPIDASRRPDLTPLLKASETVGQVIQPGAVVIYESTVYPGATEEDCIPVIERVSELTYGEDFHAGYSPERINPGDKAHRVADIVKVTSGSSPAVADFVDGLYARVITAGTHKAPSIAVAEAAKVIENTQRDVNIALVNELAILFNRLGLDTQAVLEAAGTKWNFLPFRPGLVGGHCIGVDPYYLTHKAQAVGHHPEMILAGRRLNDGMGAHVAHEVVKGLIQRGVCIPEARILVLGLAFKEDTPDLRNTRVIDIIRELEDYGASVVVHDPVVDAADAKAEFGVTLVDEEALARDDGYDAAILTVAHRALVERGAAGIREWLKPGGYLFDVKYALAAGDVDGRL